MLDGLVPYLFLNNCFGTLFVLETKQFKNMILFLVLQDWV